MHHHKKDCERPFTSTPRSVFLLSARLAITIVKAYLPGLSAFIAACNCVQYICSKVDLTAKLNIWISLVDIKQHSLMERTNTRLWKNAKIFISEHEALWILIADSCWKVFCVGFYNFWHSRVFYHPHINELKLKFIAGLRHKWPAPSHSPKLFND